MELSGTVVLDERSMDRLRREIRKEVIEDIKNNGYYSNEIEGYMLQCSYDDYMRLIECTIDDIISKTEEEDIHFESGWKRWHILLAIRSLLKI